jgi:hypothetical protein
MQTVKMQTVNQYIASVKMAGAPADMRHQASVWPYPQEDQCCLEIWRDSWPHEPATMPSKRIPIRIMRGCSGLYVIKQGERKPKEIARELREG